MSVVGDVQRSAAFQQQPDSIGMPLVSRPVQTGFAALELCIYFHTVLQQEFDDAIPAEFASPSESVDRLLTRRRRFQLAGFVKEGFHDVQTADAGRPFEIEARAAVGKILGGLPAAIVQAAVDGAARDGTVDICAALNQQIQKLELHACSLRVVTGCGQVQSRRSPAICLRFGVDVRARVQEQCCDLDNVLWRFLAKVLDAVCRNIVEQGGAVLAR